jgi:CubicO group peptidase (beta-lactamase class C family)
MKLQGGIIYMNKNGRFPIHETFGYRDYPNRLKNDRHTSFPTASFGKIFVAVGILKLIEEGAFTLETNIKSLLPFRLYFIDQGVTVKQLLTHTSGVPDYCDEEKVPNYADLWKDFPNYKIRQNKDLLPLFIKEKMKYEKGTKFEYNNSAFVLLAAIIEEVKNIPFDEYLNQIIFQPLKMKRTGYYELDRLPKNCANAYIFDEKKQEYYTNIYSVDAKGTGAGGAYTNAYDLNLFWTGLLSHKIINKLMLDLMLERHVDQESFGYGLGVWLDKNNNPYIVGSDPGVSCISCHNVKTHEEITIISNYGEDVFHYYNEIKK